MRAALCAQMPRYYFHIKRGQMTVVDRVGTDLPGLSEKKADGEAVRSPRATP